MTSPSERAFVADLLRQDEALSDSQYKAYRMNLEQALVRAERRESVARYVVAAACVVSVILMFVGGSRVLGSFDPWSADATAISVGLAVVYLVATVLAAIGLASYYSRFRPSARNAREAVRDGALRDLQRELHELREQLRRPRSDDAT